MDQAWMAATEDQYDDDSNLAARQAVFGYLVEADPMPEPLSEAENGPIDRQALLTEVGLRAAARIAAAGSVELTQRRGVFICRD